MTRTSVSVFQGDGKAACAISIEDAAGAIFDRALALPGSGKEHLLLAFEEALGQFTTRPQGQDSVRDICKAAALSTARGHGNIIETGRILLGSIDELGGAFKLELRRCKENALLGLAEGACQVGPIVYGRFLDIATEYRDNADEWIAKHRRRQVSFDPSALPVIVPFESELTLKTKSFAASDTVTLDTSVPPVMDKPEQSRTESEVSPPVVSQDKVEESAPEPHSGWSRPKGKGFFRRLSDVMGGLFGRRG